MRIGLRGHPFAGITPVRFEGLDNYLLSTLANHPQLSGDWGQSTPWSVQCKAPKRVLSILGFGSDEFRLAASL